ncbi:MAG: cupin domain-containing protein [Lentisphaerota bacterium]
MKTASDWIELLKLQRHPEGGYYRENYRAEEILNAQALPSRYGGPRSLCTSIYFLLAGEDKSHFHRLKSDEIWHFYDGTSLAVHALMPDGGHESWSLGPNPEDGDVLQLVIPRGAWFGAGVKKPGSFALIGCTVAPGFDFADFELADRKNLASLYPSHRALIEDFTLPSSS